jgi:hypothetical protein
MALSFESRERDAAKLVAGDIYMITFGTEFEFRVVAQKVRMPLNSGLTPS